MDLGAATNTVYEFSDNQVFDTSAWGLNLWGAFNSTTLLVKNDVVTGTGMGLYLDDTATFSGDMKCRFLRNAVENVSDIGIFLGQGVTDCLVVCKSPQDTVKNLGTDNQLVGCHPVTAGETMKEGVRSRLHWIP
jgi:hypothetical protein